MNLVFFDIECASVYKTSAKICAFGYVICDEQFNIIAKEDILVNPRGKFHLTDGRGEHGLVLPYEYEEFKKHPAFPEVYGKIKKLLMDKDSLIFGHATLNDVNYLDLETKRYRLPPFSFEFFDSQLMYMTSVGDFSRQFGLEYITKDLDVQFTPHRAADDAYATMRVVEALCKKHGCDFLQLEKLLKLKRGKLKEHKVTLPDSAAFAAHRQEAKRKKEERSRRRCRFYNKVNSKHRATSGKLKGKVFCFSRPLEDEIDLSIPLLEGIFNCGGRYSSKIEESTVYVCKASDETVRTQNARKIERLTVITPERLTEMIND